jgi:hypothetical protein
LTDEVSQETTSNEGQDGYSGRQDGMKTGLSSPEAGNSRIPAHERDVNSQEKKSISIQIASDQGKEDG